jgi:hypothetical protein
MKFAKAFSQLVVVIQAGCEGSVALRAKQLRYRRGKQIAKDQY